MSDLGLIGAGGAAGAEKALRDMLAQRLAAEALEREQQQQQFENAIKTRQLDQNDDLKRLSIDIQRQAREDALNAKDADTLTRQVSLMHKGDVLSPDDVSRFTKHGLGSLVTHKDATLGGTEYQGNGSMPNVKTGSTPGTGFIRTRTTEPQDARDEFAGTQTQADTEARLAELERYHNLQGDIATVRNEIAQTRANQNAGGAAAAGVDPAAIGEAIMSGDQPPETTGLYRYGAAVRTYLAKKGYNLANAQTDWRATQRHFATLNGPQQTRLRQAAETAYESLDVIESLSEQWSRSGFPLLNRAKLAAAKSGALGPEAQSIATQLEAQIGDITSELGNVYMGGNSPTDHALSLAAKNLSANWSDKQLKDAIGLARQNLRIRLNSIQNIGAITTSGQAPGPINPATPAPAAAPTGAQEFDWVDGKLVPKAKQ